jgi:hypothetical protein
VYPDEVSVAGVIPPGKAGRILTAIGLVGGYSVEES